MLEKITTPPARASVVWMLGAYHHLIPKVEPVRFEVVWYQERAQ